LGRKFGRHIAGDYRPLKDSMKFIKTQKAIKNAIESQNPPSKTLERLPSGVANYASGKTPLLLYQSQSIGIAMISVKIQSNS
jgi:hypothetical protein